MSSSLWACFVIPLEEEKVWEDYGNNAKLKEIL